MGPPEFQAAVGSPGVEGALKAKNLVSRLGYCLPVNWQNLLRIPQLGSRGNTQNFARGDANASPGTEKLTPGACTLSGTINGVGGPGA